MKTRRTVLCWLLLLSLLAVSCDETQKYTLRSVSTDETDIQLPVGGSATLRFRVDEADYAFDLDKDVVLFLGRGPFAASNDFYLAKVVRDTEPGYYQAVITDRGVSDDYYEEVSLGVRKPDDTMQLSALFHVQGEFGGPLGPVKKTGLPILYLDTQYGAAITSKESYVKMTLTLEEQNACTLRCSRQVHYRLTSSR